MRCLLHPKLPLRNGGQNGFSRIKEAALEARHALEGLTPFLRLRTDYQSLSGQVGVAGEAFGFRGEASLLLGTGGPGLAAKGERAFGLGRLYLAFTLPQDLTPRLTLAGLVPF